MIKNFPFLYLQPYFLSASLKDILKLSTAEVYDLGLQVIWQDSIDTKVIQNLYK